MDAANAARDVLLQHGIAQQDVYDLWASIADGWTSIALHTTSGIPQYMHPVVALLTAGVEMDVLREYSEFSEVDARERPVVRSADPSSSRFLSHTARILF